MDEICETVMVMADNDMGCMVINKSDYDSAVHTLVDDGESNAGNPEGGNATKAELHAALTAKGIEYKNSMTKAELQALLDGA